MKRFNETESVIFKFCKCSLVLKDFLSKFTESTNVASDKDKRRNGGSICVLSYFLTL